MQTCAITRIKLKYFTSFLQLAAVATGTAETLYNYTVKLTLELASPVLPVLAPALTRLQQALQAQPLEPLQAQVQVQVQRLALPAAVLLNRLPGLAR